MSLLIKGMEMPEHETVLAVRVYSDGLVTVWDKKVGWIHHYAIPVSPHGRLIDADALAKVMAEGIAPSGNNVGFQHPFDIFRAIAATPTIIPAEEGE